MVLMRRLEWMAMTVKMVAPSVVTTRTTVAIKDAHGPNIVRRGPPSGPIRLGTAMSPMKNTTPKMALAGKCGERAPRLMSGRPVLISSSLLLRIRMQSPVRERDHDREHRHHAERDDDVIRQPLADVERQARQQLVVHRLRASNSEFRK